MRRALAAAWLAALLGAVLPAAAGAYGVSTAYVGQVTATNGAWDALGPAQSDADDGAAATLTEADAGEVGAMAFPANRDFATSSAGWQVAAGTCTGLACSSSAGHDATAGDPPGSVQVSVTAGLLTPGGVTSTLRSPSFTWSSGAPASVSFAIDRRAALPAGATGSWGIQLVDEAGGASAIEPANTSLPADATFRTITRTVPAGSVQHGRTYHLLITTTLDAPAIQTARVHYDDVTLMVTPRNARATGQLRVTGVVPGATTTLETRVRTDGEAFDLQVWDGSAWTTRLAVTSTAFATLSHGLTAAEQDGGEVRVRAVDRDQGVDDVDSRLLVDHLRVVSTGAVSVTAPAAVTLPARRLDGHGGSSSASMGAVEVVDTGGAASGWTLSATATRWGLVADPSVLLPAGAATLTPGAATSPAGSSLTGVSAGAAGALGEAPLTVMQAAAGTGIGAYRLSPTLTLAVPANAVGGDYRSVITFTVS